MNGTKERHAWCYLQVKLCDPRLSALCVPPWPKRRYINTLPFVSFLVHVSLSAQSRTLDVLSWLISFVRSTPVRVLANVSVSENVLTSMSISIPGLGLITLRDIDIMQWR